MFSCIPWSNPILALWLRRTIYIWEWDFNLIDVGSDLLWTSVKYPHPIIIYRCHLHPGFGKFNWSHYKLYMTHRLVIILTQWIMMAPGKDNEYLISIGAKGVKMGSGQVTFHISLHTLVLLVYRWLITGQYATGGRSWKRGSVHEKWRILFFYFSTCILKSFTTSLLSLIICI